MTNVPFFKQARDPQPIMLIQNSFLYQLDAPMDEGGVNLWQCNLQNSNGHDPMYAIKAAKLFAAAEDMLEALHRISLCSQNSMSSKEECGRIARAAIDKATT